MSQITQDTTTITHKIPPAKEIIKRAWVFYKTNFRRLWPLFLFGSIGEMSFNFSFSRFPNFTNHIPLSIVLTVIALGIIFVIFTFLSKIALYKSISDIKKGQELKVRDWYKKGMNIFWGFVYITILYVLAEYGGFSLLIIPGIILSGYLIFTKFEYINDNKKGFNALLGSWSIVKGRWWKTFWKTVVVYLFIMFPSFVAIGFLFIILIVIGILLKLSALFAFIGTSIMLVSVALIVLLLTIPLSTLSMYEIYLELKNNPIEQQSEIVDKKRKKKIITCVILGIIVIPLSVFLVPYFSNYLNKIGNSSSNQVYEYIPSSGFHTFESPLDVYTVEYPVTWGIYDEVLPTKDSYYHGIMFVPSSELQENKENNNTFTQTSFSIYVLSLPEGISKLEQFKDYYLNSVKKNDWVKISNITSTSTLFGIFPAIELSFDETDDVKVGTSTQMIRKDFKTKHIIFFRGDFVFMLSYSASPERFEKYSGIVDKMIESFYPYYYHKKVGEYKEYINTEHQFSINYPKNYFPLLADPGKGNIVSFVNRIYDDNGSLIADKEIGVRIFSSNINPKIMTDEFIRSSKDQYSDLNIVSTSSIIVSGQNANRVDYIFNDKDRKSIKSTSILLRKDNRFIRIDFFLLDNSEIDSILNSFKFISKIPYKPIGMKLYQNKRFGTSIYIPEKWSYLKGLDETLLFVDTFMSEKINSDPFTGSLSISIPDDYYVNQDNYNLENYVEDSLSSWKKTILNSNFTLLEKGAITTSSGLEMKYFVAEYDGIDKGGQKIILGVKQFFIMKNNVIRFVTFIDDKEDFLKEEKIMYEVMKSFDVI
ncbi:MAG: PsbP-related protein [Patescibacteria group bacterium]